jgi:hypothetical protein
MILRISFYVVQSALNMTRRPDGRSPITLAEDIVTRAVELGILEDNHKTRDVDDGHCLSQWITDSFLARGLIPRNDSTPPNSSSHEQNHQTNNKKMILLSDERKS